LPEHGPVEVVALSGLHHIRLVVEFPVQVENLVPHLQRVPRQSDEALDQRHVLFVMGVEDQDIAAPGFRVSGDADAGERNARADGGPVHHQEVSHQQGVLHGSGGDHEGLNEEHAKDQEQDQREKAGLQPFGSRSRALLPAAVTTPLPAGLAAPGRPLPGRGALPLSAAPAPAHR